jgi:hypothetical protein
MYRINDAGIRSDREFSIQPNSLLRIAAFGDSFTYGAGVNNEDTWEEQLSRSRPGIEVLNFGVGAYGLDQAYLRYGVDGTAYRSDIVIIGFMSENIFRNVNVFRPFYDSSYQFNLLPKPRFILDRGQLVRLENPLQTVQDFRRLVNDDRQVLSEFGRNDYHYLRRYQEGAFDFLPSVRFGKAVTQFVRRRDSSDDVVVNGSYNTNSEAFKVTEKIFDEFYRAALKNGSLPIIVVFPDLGDFRTFRQGRRVRYQPLLDVFVTKGYRFVDSMKSFTDYDPRLRVEDLTADHYGHYSRLGNSIIAGSLLRFLEQHGLTSRNFVKQKIKEERARLGLSAKATSITARTRPRTVGQIRLRLSSRACSACARSIRCLSASRESCPDGLG